jgi:tetratricopeptide (TPR) repeat protein
MKRTHKPYSEELHKLLGKVSSNILNARAAMAKLVLERSEGMDGNDSERAKQLFEQAAEFEQEVAMLLESEGHHEDVYISLVSAASCYQNAERYDKALLLFQQALARPEMPGKLRSEVELLSKSCEIAIMKVVHKVI